MIGRLKLLSMFQGLSDEVLSELLPFIEQHTFSKDHLIIEQGHVGTVFYIIELGSVNIYLEQPNHIHLAILQSDAFFGEMSCLTGDPISASVRAATDVSLVALTREGLIGLMNNSEAFRMHMIEAMVKRIQKSNDRVAEEFSRNLFITRRNELEDRLKYGELVGTSTKMQQLRGDVAKYCNKKGVILITGESGVGKTHVAKRLHYTSQRLTEPVISIDASELDWNEWDSLTKATNRGTLIIEHVEQLDLASIAQLVQISSQMHLVLTANERIEQWTQAHIHIAPLRERVEDIAVLAEHFLSKTAGQESNAREQEQWQHDGERVISEEALRMLALFPYLTRNVAELMEVIEASYLLSEGREIQSSHIKFTRVRKPGSRPRIGLALGSGSLRGIAHLGVLRALEQEGIPIDIIAGTSVGSFVGGAYAAGMSVDDCEKVVMSMKWNSIVGFTFPKRSIVHNEPMVGFIERHLGQRQIEQLPMPFAAVASDANTGEAHIMRSGSLAHAVAASTAIPAVMRPVRYQEKTLVDGAIVHPVPAALVRSMGADIVIAVNVCTENFTKGAPTNFVKSLLNTIDIMSAKLVKEELQLADVIIRPELDQINSGGFKEAALLIREGERSTYASAEQIHRAIEQAT